MAAKNAVCPKCGSKEKTKRAGEGLLPERVWCCLECSALFRVSCTHQGALWQKEKRRREEGRVPTPFRKRFNTYLIELVTDDCGHRHGKPIA